MRVKVELLGKTQRHACPTSTGFFFISLIGSSILYSLSNSQESLASLLLLLQKCANSNDPPTVTVDRWWVAHHSSD